MNERAIVVVVRAPAASRSGDQVDALANLSRLGLPSDKEFACTLGTKALFECIARSEARFGASVLTRPDTEEERLQKTHTRFRVRSPRCARMLARRL